MKQLLLITIFPFYTLMITCAQKSQTFAPNGTAIKGYDPVAFFIKAAPVKGKETISYTWNEATWLFENEKNRETFMASPEKYAPQYGGYCAYGASQGHKAPIQINTWTIANNKLYFNYNAEVKTMWNKDQEKLIADADLQWPIIKDQK